MSDITSLMMVSYNRLDLTKQTLDNLFRPENTGSSFRLIIVDNGSTDGTVEYLKSLRPPSDWCVGCEISLNAENRGIAIGRNQALAVAIKFNDPYLATIDNDIIAPDNWLADIVDILQVNPSFVIGVNFEDQTYPIITLNKKTFQIKHRGNAGTALMVFNRNLHDKIGYFYYDWPAKNYAHEDADAGFRMRLAGYQIGYLSQNGTHLGVAEQDSGEYREMKNECSKANLAQFHKNCSLYASKQKPIYIPFKG